MKNNEKVASQSRATPQPMTNGQPKLHRDKIWELTDHGLVKRLMTETERSIVMRKMEDECRMKLAKPLLKSYPDCPDLVTELVFRIVPRGERKQ
jgi:hypothetical protein